MHFKVRDCVQDESGPASVMWWLSDDHPRASSGLLYLFVSLPPRPQIKYDRARTVPTFPIEPEHAMTLLTAAVALEL